MRKIWIGIVLLLACVGCSLPHDKIYETGRTRRIQLWICNEKVGEWTTTGELEMHNQTYYFKDDATGRTVAIQGTVVIETE